MTNTNSQVIDVAKTMRSVYFKMCMGILLTALVSFVMVEYFREGLTAYMMAHPITFIGLFIVELILVIVLSGKIEDLSSVKAKLIFYLFSMLNGVTLTSMLLAYTGASIATAFFITAGMFGVMSLFGYVTKRDLSGWGSYLSMALIGLIICLIVQFFFNNPMFDFLVSIAAVIIFVGLTAWDTQMIKDMAKNSLIEPENVATYGALSLYLDFINLFIHILKLIGKK